MAEWLGCFVHPGPRPGFDQPYYWIPPRPRHLPGRPYSFFPPRPRPGCQPRCRGSLCCRCHPRQLRSHRWPGCFLLPRPWRNFRGPHSPFHRRPLPRRLQPYWFPLPGPRRKIHWRYFPCLPQPRSRGHWLGCFLLLR